ncbi:MAG: FHA domain-containing protein, partial [Planctomycetota bacterium]
MQHLHDRNDRQTIPGRQAPNSLPPIELEIVLGQARNRMRPVRQRNFRLGRSESCDLVLSDAAIDDVAAYILSTPQGVWIRQVGSNTPLLVNERAVGRVEHALVGERAGRGHDVVAQSRSHPYRPLRVSCSHRQQPPGTLAAGRARTDRATDVLAGRAGRTVASSRWRASACARSQIRAAGDGGLPWQATRAGQSAVVASHESRNQFGVSGRPPAT